MPLEETRISVKDAYTRSLEEQVRSLESQLEEKEKVIRELDSAARERLAVIEGLTQGAPQAHIRAQNNTAGPDVTDLASPCMTNSSKIDLLSMVGAHLAAGFRILDIGALFTPTVPAPYTPLLEDSRTIVVGFEPLESECERLNATFGSSHKFFPYAVGDGSPARFYRCNYAMTSSIFEPDSTVMGLYQNLPEFCRVLKVSDITTVRLDDVPEAKGADYLKLDVQGSEHAVLAGARLCLDSVLVVQTEVEFVPIYACQPLFGDVDALLRARGFEFHRLLDVEGRTLRDSGLLDSKSVISQQLWADAVYIRPVTSWTALASEQLLKFAVILHHVYGSADFCARLLAAFDEREGTNFFRQYAAYLNI